MRNLCSGIRIKLSEVFLEVSYVGRYLKNDSICHFKVDIYG